MRQDTRQQFDNVNNRLSVLDQTLIQLMAIMQRVDPSQITHQSVQHSTITRTRSQKKPAELAELPNLPEVEEMDRSSLSSTSGESGEVVRSRKK
jgi:hypothetical protein